MNNRSLICRGSSVGLKAESAGLVPPDDILLPGSKSMQKCRTSRWAMHAASALVFIHIPGVDVCPAVLQTKAGAHFLGPVAGLCCDRERIFAAGPIRIAAKEHILIILAEP